MNIILTGATGTLGSQILFSILENKFDELEVIYLLVRKKNKTSPVERVSKMLDSTIVPDFVKERKIAVHKKICVVDADETLSPHKFLRNKKDHYFIHSAGFVNLSTDPSTKDEIFKENLTLTQDIFNIYAPYLKKFIFISTAFSIGRLNSLLEDDYLSAENISHRNFYEASKLAAERHLVGAGKKLNIPIQILRPSVLGGNVMDKPSFFISKYMVFYLFAKFFYRNNSSDSIRIQANKDSLLNIIPTDYAAKVITKVFDTSVEQLNIVNTNSTNIFNGINKILETVNFKNFKLTQELITTTTDFESNLERFYYETIGIHLTPYLTSLPQEWNTTLLESILPIPKYNLEDYLVATVEYAKANGFKNQRW